MTEQPERARGIIRTSLLVLLFGALAFGPGCNRGGRAARSASEADRIRGTDVRHEECKLDTATEKLDADGDGKPELSVVARNGKPVCQGADLNQDGVIDIWSYFAPDGSIRRRELAYSRDARITEIRVYRGGALQEIQQSTAFAGKLDTWHYYEGGKRVRTERDGNGDGRVDEWWEYPNPKRPGCPVMYSDGDGDGKPDPDSGVDLCKHGYVPPERDTHRYESPDFTRPGAVPTEVESEGDASSEGGEDAE